MTVNNSLNKSQVLNEIWFVLTGCVQATGCIGVCLCRYMRSALAEHVAFRHTSDQLMLQGGPHPLMTCANWMKDSSATCTMLIKDRNLVTVVPRAAPAGAPAPVAAALPPAAAPAAVVVPPVVASPAKAAAKTMLLLCGPLSQPRRSERLKKAKR
jgi:hypothetical protein